jgi:hypothetical protein
MAAVAAMLLASSALAGEPAGGRSLTERIADELTAGGSSSLSQIIAEEIGLPDDAAVRAEQGVTGPEGVRDNNDPPRDDRRAEPRDGDSREILRRMTERRKEELRQGQRSEESRRPDARQGERREDGQNQQLRVTVHAERVNEGSEEAQRPEAREGAQREIQQLETQIREIQERLTELRRGARGEDQQPEAQKFQPRQGYEPRWTQRGETSNEPPRPGMPGMSRQPMSPGSGQGPMMGRGFGQGPMMGRGQGQGPMMGRGFGQGQGPMMGRGQGPMMGRGQGQGPMMGRGQGRGQMMGRGFGQGPMMGRGQGPMMGRGQGPMMGRGRGWGSMMQGHAPWAGPQAGPRSGDMPGCPMCQARGGICPMCQSRLGQMPMGGGPGQGPMMGRGFGQGPMMGRGQGQGPMMGRGFGQGQMMGRDQGQGQGPMMQGRRPEAMPEGRLQQRREGKPAAMPEQGPRKRPMPEGPEAKAITPSFKVPLAGRAARLLEPGVAEKLRLSDEQRDRIHRLLAEYGEQIARMSERVANAVRDIPAGQRAGKAAEIVGSAKKHAYDLASKLVDKATDVLTPRQRAAVEKLLDGMDKMGKMGKAPKSQGKEDGDDNDDEAKDDDNR